MVNGTLSAQPAPSYARMRGDGKRKAWPKDDELFWRDGVAPRACVCVYIYIYIYIFASGMTVPFVSQPNTMEMETILLEPNTVTIPYVQLENMSSL